MWHLIVKIGFVLYFHYFWCLTGFKHTFDTFIRYYCVSDGEHRLNMLVFLFFGRPGVIEGDYLSPLHLHFGNTALECNTMPSFSGCPISARDAGARVSAARGGLKRRRVSDATSLNSAQLEVRELQQLVATGVSLKKESSLPCWLVSH